MRKIILFISLFGFYISTGYSRDVTLEEVKEVAGVHARLGYTLKLNAGALSVPDYSVKEIKTLNNVDGELLAYVILLQPKGFIVVSKDDNIKPVIAYSFNSDFSFSESKDNILIHMLKEDMGKRIEAIPFTLDEIKNKNKQLWNNYVSQPDYIFRLQSAEQWPADDDTGWIDTTWHQSSPYNDLCPIDPNTGDRCIVGCVATAIAQIVNFHKYPSNISFSDEDSYISKEGEPEEVKIDADHITYVFPSFDELNNKLSNIDYNDSIESYAPALSFACGIIVKMAYTSERSGANYSAENFTEKLKYSDAVGISDTDPEFYNTLKEDMKSRKPALLSIANSDYAVRHAIVADGYRTTEEYHLNFGWGSYNPGGGNNPTSAWYSLPDGMPEDYVFVYYGVLGITAPDLNPYNSYEYPISYPSPFRLGKINKVRIVMPSAPVGLIDKVRIYTVSGNLVREIPGGDLYVEWNGKNDSGKKCVPGLYFYSMRTTEKENHRGKITILH